MHFFMRCSLLGALQSTFFPEGFSMQLCQTPPLPDSWLHWVNSISLTTLTFQTWKRPVHQPGFNFSFLMLIAGLLWLPWSLPEEECIPLWLQHEGNFVASRLHCGWPCSHRGRQLQGKSLYCIVWYIVITTLLWGPLPLTFVSRKIIYHWPILSFPFIFSLKITILAILPIQLVIMQAE